jgi:hypothetical protein
MLLVSKLARTLDDADTAAESWDEEKLRVKGEGEAREEVR